MIAEEDPRLDVDAPRMLRVVEALEPKLSDARGAAQLVVGRQLHQRVVCPDFASNIEAGF